MAEDQVTANLKGMDDLDFVGWNNADWNGVFAQHHTNDVLVDWKGQAPTHGIAEHIDAMKAYVDSAGGTPPQITSHRSRLDRGSGPVSSESSKAEAAWSPSPSGSTVRSPRNTSGPSDGTRAGDDHGTLRVGQLPSTRRLLTCAGSLARKTPAFSFRLQTSSLQHGSFVSVILRIARHFSLRKPRFTACRCEPRSAASSRHAWLKTAFTMPSTRRSKRS